MKKEEIIKLAKSCMFTFSDAEIPYVQHHFEVLNQQINVLNEINTDDVEPMIYPFSNPVHFLREDIVDKVLSREEVLQNAVQKDDTFIKVKTKVVR